MTLKALLLGTDKGPVEALQAEVAAAGFEPLRASSHQQAYAALAGDALCAIVYEAGAEQIESICTSVRGDPRFDTIALIALVPDTGGQSLGPVFASGADDYLPLGEGGHLEGMLRELAANQQVRKPAFIKGRAILADADRQWRVQGARVLRQAGYDVHFAVDAAEVDRVIDRDPTIQLVVADVDLPGGALGVLEGLRSRGLGRPVWIACGTAGARAAIEDRLSPIESAAFHLRDSPPENLTFLINATTMTPTRSQRASERLLYSVPVSFRLDGHPGIVWGSTYNVSRGGLYVRTLTPAPFGAQVKLRLHAPAAGRLVELSGRVAWRKEFGAAGGVPGPTGMGVEVTDAGGADVTEFRASYDRMAEGSKAA